MAAWGQVIDGSLLMLTVTASWGAHFSTDGRALFILNVFASTSCQFLALSSHWLLLEERFMCILIPEKLIMLHLHFAFVDDSSTVSFVRVEKRRQTKLLFTLLLN